MRIALLMSATRKNKDVLPAAWLVIIALAAAFHPASAAVVEPPEKAELQQKMAVEQDKLERIEQGMADHRDKIRVTRAEEETLLEELEGIDEKLAIQKKKLAGLKERLAAQEKLIAAKIAELQEVMLTKEAASDKVKRRLLAFYRMGKTGFMNVIFSTSSLADLLSLQEYYRVMVEHDQKLINGYREKIARLTRIRDELQVEKDRLLRVIAGIKAQEEALAKTRAARIELLDRIHTEKRLYQRALAEMERAARRLRERISRLRSRYQGKAARRDGRRDTEKKKRPVRGFASLKGRLAPPVEGTVTTLFGKNRKDRFGITTFASGIDIRTDDGAAVRAVAAGRVVYAGTLRGYGRIIIIDHGQKYYTLASRLAEILKQEGDDVAAGEVIGTMSEQEGIFGEGLHFEIRHGTEPLDPMKWIKKGALAVEKAGR